MYNENTVLNLHDSIIPSRRVVNRGLGSDTALRMKERITKHINGVPKKIVLMVGINDLAFGRNASEIEKDYRELVGLLMKYVEPEHLLCISVLPCKSEKSSDIAIKDVNSRIQKITNENKCRYLDLYSKFLRNGTIVEEFYIDDRVHLSPLGYEKWIQEMQTFL